MWLTGQFALFSQKACSGTRPPNCVEALLKQNQSPGYQLGGVWSKRELRHQEYQRCRWRTQEAGEPPRLVTAKRDGLGRAPEPRGHRAGTHGEASRLLVREVPAVPTRLLSRGVARAHGCQKETPSPDPGLHQEACECHSYQNPVPPADRQCLHSWRWAPRTEPDPSLGCRFIVGSPLGVPIMQPAPRWRLGGPECECQHLPGLETQKEQAAESWSPLGWNLQSQAGASSQVYTPLGPH